MNIKQIKEQFTCLDYLGEPIKKVSNGYLYRCPWKEDRHPSLSVTLDGGGWHDLSDGTHGNLIDLVARCIGTNDFRQICAQFDGVTKNTSSFHQSKTLDQRKEEGNSFARFSTVPLQAHRLKDYLLKERGIRPETAIALGVVEAHYSIRADIPRDLFALAYPNDKGGFELRGAPYEGNPRGFKGSKAPKGITTHLLDDNRPYVVFEGFVDMLSFTTMTNGQKHNYVTLNSTVNAENAIEALKRVKSQIFLCLDNDHSGDEATEKMLVALSGSQDIRKGLMPHKDVNELLLHRREVQNQLEENFNNEISQKDGAQHEAILTQSPGMATR